MKFPRRRFLRLAAGVTALPAFSRLAMAATYPARPVHLVVGFAAGSAPDILARLIGQSLAQSLGQPFIIDNRPGAASNIAASSVVRANPDGYTLLLFTVTAATNATLYDDLNFNFVRDIAPVAGIARVPFVMVINPSVPATTVPEFIAYAKANPGKINMATAGNGSSPHIFGALFQAMAGIDMVPVSYRGDAPALTDLIGGQVQVMFDALISPLEQIRAGRLRALAVTTAMRSEALPDIPVMGDFLPGYEASGWQGIGAPKSTPVEITDKLNQAINAALADPKIKAQLADLGSAPLSGSPGDFGKLIADDTEKWGKVIRTANIKPE